MYDLADVHPDADIQPGTNVLVSGPPLSGKRRIAFDVLASGARRGDGSIVVTTEDGADAVLRELDALVGGIDSADVGIVDCVSKQRGVGTEDDDPRIEYASSPVDMTGIGVSISTFLREFYGSRAIERNRILLHSVSTLLMYSNLQTVFRFLHVFTGRVQSADALGVYVIDSTAHDDRTMNTLKQLFDAAIQVENDDEGEPRIRTAGRSI